ncbi:MAG: phage protease [Candidatus Gastranaerophilales bacterium]|nr:phage protease [Candidatus Gastranaerophilales bacterium]
MSWCEIFRAGKYKQADGNEIEYTNEDIKTIANNFNDGENTNAPIVIGHPKNNSPAYGWVDKLKADGGKLYAKYKDVCEDFAEWVNKGRYKNRSVSLTEDLQLRHVGFLGAVPPRVKGMPEYVFSEDLQVQTYEFSDLEDYKFDTLARIIQNLRDHLIEKYDIETADKIISTWNIETLKQVENKSPQEISSYCEELINKGKELELTTTDPKQAAHAAKTEDFSEEMILTKSENENLKQKLKAMEAQQKRQEFESFSEKAVSEGQITPAQKSDVVDFMEVLSGCETFDFAEGDEKSPVARFKEFIGGLKQIDFSELPEGKGQDDSTIDFSDPKAAANQIVAYQAEQAKKGIEVDTLTAYNALKKGKN